MFIAIQHEAALIVLAVVVLVLGGFVHHVWKERRSLYEETDGWIHFNAERILAQKPVKKLLQEVARDQRLWLPDCNERWFFEIRKRTPEELLSIAWEIGQKPNTHDSYAQRALISAACLVHGTPCPFGVWVYNRQMLELVTRYEIMRGLHWINPHKDECMPYKPCIDLPSLTAALLDIDWLWTDVIAKGRGSPYFFSLWKHLTGLGHVKPGMGEDMDVLRKALTVIYAIIEIPMPRDYRYFDEEVKALIESLRSE